MENRIDARIAANRQLIALNNFANREDDKRPQLEYARPTLEAAFKKTPDVVYLGYAAKDMDAKTEVVFPRLAAMGAREITALHRYRSEEAVRILEQAGAIYIDGGNTYTLIANLKGARHATGQLVDPRSGAYDGESLVDVLRELAGNGKTLIGLSAGAIAFCSEIRIADDPTSPVQKNANGDAILHMDGLKLLPEDLQIMPHHLDPVDEVFSPEQLEAFGPVARHYLNEMQTTAARIANSLQMDPSKLFLSVRDLSYLTINGHEMKLEGETGAVIFEQGKEKKEVHHGSDLSYLLQK